MVQPRGPRFAAFSVTVSVGPARRDRDVAQDEAGRPEEAREQLHEHGRPQQRGAVKRRGEGQPGHARRASALFFFGYGAFLAFSTASGRLGTAQKREARGVARFRANGAKTCIFVFFEHFSELARAARGHVIRNQLSRNPKWTVRGHAAQKRGNTLKLSPEINVEELQYFFSSFSTFQQHPSARSSMTGRNSKDKKSCEK